MNRRQFLKGAGASATLAAGVATTGATMASSNEKGKGPGGQPDKGPFIDGDRLRTRNSDRSTVVAQHGLVCTSQPLASLAGVDVLRAGGNCIDAAIAANAVLGVTEPAMCGIGGDLFAIVWIERDKRLYGLNASGRSPASWSLDKARELNLESIPRRSALSWSVPGCVSGWELLRARFGRQSFAQLLEPAIAYARDGFPLSPIIATHFDWSDDDSPHMASVYHPGGKVPGFGDVFRNPALAWSYEQLAKGGAAAFYEGEIAERIVAKSSELGGLMSTDDLSEHTANWVDPVKAAYRGWDIWELPPNGQGIAALQMLNLLEQFDIASLEPNSAEHLHLLVEAKKLAFEDRAEYYADPAHAEIPTEWLISKSYAQERAALIDPRRARTQVAHGDPQLDSDTIYLTAADGDGNMISFIQSIYSGFGSTICPDGVGFAMQNRGQAFSLDPGHRNRLEPRKRPFHTIIPAFMTKDDDPILAFGVMGGDFQPQGHAQVIMNMIDFGMSPQQAGDQPRLAHVGSSSPWGAKASDAGRLVFENSTPDDVKLQLAEMGHRISSRTAAHGGYQAIWRRDEPLVYFGGSDPRKDGLAIGY